jgi:hypothetical protein
MIVEKVKHYINIKKFTLNQNYNTNYNKNSYTYINQFEHISVTFHLTFNIMC